MVYDSDCFIVKNVDFLKTGLISAMQVIIGWNLNDASLLMLSDLCVNQMKNGSFISEVFFEYPIRVGKLAKGQLLNSQFTDQLDRLVCRIQVKIISTSHEICPWMLLVRKLIPT